MESEYLIGLAVGSYYSPRALLRKDGTALFVMYEWVTRKSYSIWIHLEHITDINSLSVALGDGRTEVILTSANIAKKPLYARIYAIIQSLLLTYHTSRYPTLTSFQKTSDTFFAQLHYDVLASNRPRLVAGANPTTDSADCTVLPFGHNLFTVETSLCGEYAQDIADWFCRHGHTSTVCDSFDLFLSRAAQNIMQRLLCDRLFLGTCVYRFFQYRLLEEFLSFCMRGADNLDLRQLYRLVLKEEVLDEASARCVLRLPTKLYFVDIKTPHLPHPLHLYGMLYVKGKQRRERTVSRSTDLVLELFTAEKRRVNLYLDTSFVDLCQLLTTCYSNREYNGIERVLTLAQKQFSMAGIF